MRLHFLMTLLFNIALFQQLFAQDKSGNIWVFGGGRAATATFVDTNKPIVFPRFTTPPLYFTHGHSNICDSTTGKLLFSCNGMILYDSNCNVMENGDSLVPHKAYTHNSFPNAMYTQGSIIIPKGNGGLYYVFVCTITDSMYNFWYTNPFGDGRFPHNLLLYNIVDMNANGGLGKVIVKNKPLLSGVDLHKTGMMVCRHANGQDWWLLKQGQYDTNQIYRFLVKADTIEGPWLQSFTIPDHNSYAKYWDLTGQYAFSPDGKKFASVKLTCQQLFLADFDRCSGEIHNARLVNIPIDTTPSLDPKYKLDSALAGVCFSPNNEFVYISKRWNIYQYEFGEQDSSQAWYHVKQGPDTTVQKFQYYNSLHLGIDKRIYIGNWGGQHKQMSVIDKPDIKGIGCNFCRKCFRLDDTTYMGFTAPPTIPDFNLGLDSTSCWPLNQSESVKAEIEWSVYPNPAHETIIIQNASGKRKILYSALGEAIVSTLKNELDVSRLPKGVYYLYCGNKAKKVVVD